MTLNHEILPESQRIRYGVIVQLARPVDISFVTLESESVHLSTAVPVPSHVYRKYVREAVGPTFWGCGGGGESVGVSGPLSQPIEADRRPPARAYVACFPQLKWGSGVVGQLGLAIFVNFRTC